jgi:hypothetical protein
MQVERFIGRKTIQPMRLHMLEKSFQVHLMHWKNDTFCGMIFFTYYFEIQSTFNNDKRKIEVSCPDLVFDQPVF